MNEITIESAKAETPAEFVSSKYNHFKTHEIAEIFQAKGWRLEIQTEARIRKNVAQREGKQRHMLTFSHPDFKTEEGRLQIVVRNAHDRTGSLEMYFGFHRVFCGNQLYKRFGDNIIRIRHTRPLSEVASAVETIIDRVDKFHRSIQLLQKATLTEDQVSRITKKAIELRYQYSKNVPDISVREVQIVRRQADAGQTAWLAMQRAQESLVRGGIAYTNGKGRRYKTREMKSINSLPEFNSRLWEIVEGEVASGVLVG